MFSLPRELTPSELLTIAELPSPVDRLLRASRSSRREQRWLQAERCASYALQADQGTTLGVHRATALIHLADVHREMNRLDRGLAECQQAYRSFRRQTSRPQRHNEAVAAYAVGLMHQAIGERERCLRWYHSSSQLFRRVREDWAAVDALAWVDACSRVQRWIDLLVDYVTAALTDAETSFSPRVWVPIIVLEKQGRIVEQLVVEKPHHGVTAALRPFEVYPLAEGWGFQRRPGIAYDAQEIPSGARRALDADAKDNALVQWEENLSPEDIGQTDVLVESDVGTFIRDAAGRLYVVRPGPTIIGGSEREYKPEVGYIPALLKPTTLEPDVASSAEPSRDASSTNARDGYSRLLSIVGGDGEVARRLVEYERQLTPDARREELIENAIDRIIADTR